MNVAVRAGALYFAVVFAIGFALGTVRTLLVVSRTGELLAVLLELPVILAGSWLVSLHLCRRLRVPTQSASRLTMGATALLLLLLAEWMLSVAVVGRSGAEHLAHYLTAAGALGLAGQFAFAAFPWLQAQTR